MSRLTLILTFVQKRHNMHRQSVLPTTSQDKKYKEHVPHHLLYFITQFPACATFPTKYITIPFKIHARARENIKDSIHVHSIYC